MIFEKQRGFTLIELLVVIAIIGVLATVVLASFSQARASARDAQRLSDIRTIQSALEIYNIDNGGYPITIWSGSHRSDTWEALGNTLGVTLPVDPINSSNTTNPRSADAGNYVYSYFSHPNIPYCSGRAYMLVFNLEGKNGDGPNDGVRLCNSSVYSYGNAFTVGVGSDGNMKTPDLTGSAK